MENLSKEKNFGQTIDELVNDPMIKGFREHELRKAAYWTYSRSKFGRISSLIYLVLGFTSIFVYWLLFRINFFLAVLFGIITWFVLTYILDRLFIHISGIERLVKNKSKKNIQSSAEKLKAYNDDSL